MSRKSRKCQDRFFITVIALLSLCAVGLIAAIALQSRMTKPSDTAVQALSEQTDATSAPLTVVSADSQLTVGNDEPQTQPTASLAPAPTNEPFEYLPVYTGIETTEKVIALTVDDCTNLAALKYAAQAAEHYGAKLTLLPVASSVLTEDNRAALQYCVFTLGYQVENRTLNNSALYSLSDFELANEIWTADMAVDYALNMDYGMHLLRTKGGQGTKDPRTHAYLKQLGYDGFLTWSVEASGHSADELKSSIQPGGIYLFNCTKDEVIKLAEFMKFAKSLGYRMVTVNELLGFEENSCTSPEDDILSRKLVELTDYTAPTVEYSDGDRAYGVYMLQKMLYDMGYLKDASATAAPVEGGAPEPTLYLDSLAAQQKFVDGVFGQTTRSAIMAFQAAHNLPCTGVASAEIQQMIQEEYAQYSGQ